jgi:ATP-dependent helicase HrpB
MLTGVTRLADAAKLDLLAILRDRLGRNLASRLDRELPATLALPGGHATIDYTQPEPMVSARAQAFFGLRESPVFAGGRVRAKFSLLSPAMRPVAITGDLAGFWKTGWAEVRRDMRGRYPKHSWPEDGGRP